MLKGKVSDLSVQASKVADALKSLDGFGEVVEAARGITAGLADIQRAIEDHQAEVEQDLSRQRAMVLALIKRFGTGSPEQVDEFMGSWVGPDGEGIQNAVCPDVGAGKGGT